MKNFGTGNSGAASVPDSSDWSPAATIAGLVGGAFVGLLAGPAGVAAGALIGSTAGMLIDYANRSDRTTPAHPFGGDASGNSAQAQSR